MDQIHKLLLTGEIVSGTVAGLIALSSILWVIRRKLSGPPQAFVPSLDVPKAEALAAQEGWLHRSLVALDIFLNVVVLRGNQNETISAHSWRADQKGHLWGKLMNKWLNGFQDNHGFKAASGDLERSSAEVAVLKRALGV